MSNLSDDFMQKVSKLQDTYYAANPKRIIMKKQQKNECANVVSKLVGTNNMLTQCIYVFDGYKLYIDYTVFKTFVCPDNYNLIIEYVINIMHAIINEYGRYQLYVNLNTFSISALERYRVFFQQMSVRCAANQFDRYVEIVHIHNSPSFLSATSGLLAQFMSDSVKNKISFISKTELNKLPDMISKKIT